MSGVALALSSAAEFESLQDRASAATAAVQGGLSRPGEGGGQRLQKAEKTIKLVLRKPPPPVTSLPPAIILRARVPTRPALAVWLASLTVLRNWLCLRLCKDAAEFKFQERLDAVEVEGLGSETPLKDRRKKLNRRLQVSAVLSAPRLPAVDLWVVAAVAVATDSLLPAPPCSFCHTPTRSLLLNFEDYDLTVRAWQALIAGMEKTVESAQGALANAVAESKVSHLRVCRIVSGYAPTRLIRWQRCWTNKATSAVM